MNYEWSIVNVTLPEFDYQYSIFTIHNSQFTIHNSPLTIYAKNGSFVTTDLSSFPRTSI